jgi:preprotein translocase subunit SecD
MRRGTLTLLFFIILLAAGSAFVVFWPNTPYHGVTNPFAVTLGLDLQGGTSIQLEPVSGQNATDDEMETTRSLLEQRLNSGLGVKELTVRTQSFGGNRSIIVELPHFSGNQQDALSTLLQTGKLEFWGTGTTNLQQGTKFDPSQYTAYNPGGQAQFQGSDLDSKQLGVSQDPTTGQYQIDFSFQGSAATRFAQYTANNVGNVLTVTLDRTVLTSPTIQSTITGQGNINGNFTYDQAKQLYTDLKYGALPIVLHQTSSEVIGGTLGADTITRSLMAGIIGLGIVVLFMLIYYRLPGFLADIALVLYSLLTFAIFKLIGVTMSLAGIAGFILSIGMAVDANVLIFERIKEELRAGRLLSAAIDIGWKRAWPSIRDSNLSTFITCAVLYAFGSNFGATTIVGFATTLFLGVAVSMFTAVVVTRTFLNLLVPTGVINHPALFGLPADAVPASSANLARRKSAV